MEDCSIVDNSTLHHLTKLIEMDFINWLARVTTLTSTTMKKENLFHNPG